MGKWYPEILGTIGHRECERVGVASVEVLRPDRLPFSDS